MGPVLDIERVLEKSKAKTFENAEEIKLEEKTRTLFFFTSLA